MLRNEVFSLSLSGKLNNMSKIHLIKGEFKEKLDLLFAPEVKTGFPSPAGDYLHESLDFNMTLSNTLKLRSMGVWMEMARRIQASVTAILQSFTADLSLRCCSDLYQ